MRGGMGMGSLQSGSQFKVTVTIDNAVLVTVTVTVSGMLLVLASSHFLQRG